MSSRQRPYFWALQTTLLVAVLILSACLPEQKAVPGNISDNTNTTGGTTGGTPTTGTITYPYTQNFLQESGTQTIGVLSIPNNFSDSFLIRGQGLATWLAALPNATKICLVAEFSGSTGNKVWVGSAQHKIFNDTVKKTTEHYLQVYPNNELTNQVDCLSSGVVSSITTDYNVTSVAITLPQICPSCPGSLTSQGLKLYLNSGSASQNVDISNTKIMVTPSVVNGGTGNQCVSHSACMAQGYSCCLEGQCVRDGAIRADVDQNSASFLAAQQDVINNPTRFKNYPQFYYVCGNESPTDPSNGDDDPVDPDYAAQERLRSLRDLYECLNLQEGEFSYCAVTYQNASTLINPNNVASPPGANFATAPDDVNFSTINTGISSDPISRNNIVEIRYAGVTLFKQGSVAFNPADGNLNSDYNDSLLSSGKQTALIKTKLPTSALDDNLTIKYKVDGTCEKLSTVLVRCTKTYIQGQVSSPIKSTDHNSGDMTFKIPPWGNTTYNVIVKVNEAVVSPGASTWTQSGLNINFTSTVHPNQKVEITYYATNNVATLTASRDSALIEVNTLCGCNGITGCNLKPKVETINGAQTITDYECSYPANSEEPPLQQTVYVSAKTVPSRYFDSYGVGYDNDAVASAPVQELAEFKYTNSDPVKPNNTTSYIGFNEIYGSFNKSSNAAKPAKMIVVKKDRTYDIFTDQGSFSSCENCGNDPYASILRLFPHSFSTKGGGYYPDNFNSSRINNTGPYRADELAFGRSCFVPATMLPWTHTQSGDVTSQRRKRLAAQHFLFANGYNRDWYGFDYGSLIGSFDGVTWFSVGNQRRIKAASNRLFLAVNAYFGDQTIDNNFKVVVSESVSVANSGSFVTHDTMSDGAECQKSHYCSTDNDCIKQLGYDYTCQNIGQIQTPWPNFDASATELAGTNNRFLSQLVGGINGQAKRCVYRGRGAPCTRDVISLTNPFNGITPSSSSARERGLHMCSPNNYCESLNTAKFNTAIARYAISPVGQNIQSITPAADTVGQGARTIGRPMKYYGESAPPTTSEGHIVKSLLNTNNIQSICVPGKEALPYTSGTVTFESAGKQAPSSSTESADKIFGIGRSIKHGSTLLQNRTSVAYCPATDSQGNYLYISKSNLYSDIVENGKTAGFIAASQNIPSSILDLSIFSGQGIYSVSGSTNVTSIGYQRYSCLRAPGAACLTDMDCAPSQFVAGKAKLIGDWGGINEAEQKFWQEELVCGNPKSTKNDEGGLNSDYNILENKCCREIEKTFTVYSQYDQGDVFQACNGSDPAIPGLNININASTRYTRNTVVADQVSCNGSTQYPALIVPSARGRCRLTDANYSSGCSTERGATANTAAQNDFKMAQYKTLDLMNQRMCCTKNWVREFAPENGGGHLWNVAKQQVVNKSIFREVSWWPQGMFQPSTDGPWYCNPDEANQPSCEMRALTPTLEKQYLDWIEDLELVGIPQALIKVGNNAMVKTAGAGQSTPAADCPIDNTIYPLNSACGTSVSADASDGSTSYYSLANYSKLKMSGSNTFLKKVFSENEFSCCLPAGTSIPANTTAKQCCTGTVTNQDGPMRCCLEDLTDITLYLNRYVSSEGSGLPDSAYDPATGYIKDPALVKQIAEEKGLCCSGKLIQGFAIHEHFVPVSGSNTNVAPDVRVRRFAYRDDAVDNNTETGGVASLYDAGLRWNHHWYCAPQDLTDPRESN